MPVAISTPGAMGPSTAWAKRWSAAASACVKVASGAVKAQSSGFFGADEADAGGCPEQQVVGVEVVLQGRARLDEGQVEEVYGGTRRDDRVNRRRATVRPDL